MPLLKASVVSGGMMAGGGGAIVMELGDLEREAAGIVNKARAEAERLMAMGRAEAAKDAARVREEARAAGQAEGFAKGQEEGRKAGHDEAVATVGAMLNELTARWSQALEILHQNMPAHVADAKTDLVKLGLAIAGKVTRSEALRNRQVAVDTAAEALRLAAGARLVTLHVHPMEQAMVERYLPALVAKVRTIGSVELVADEEMKAGDVVARFGGGEVDGRMETQLERIAEEMLGDEGKDERGKTKEES